MSRHLDRTSVDNKGYIIRSKGELFLAGPIRKVASGQDESILPAGQLFRRQDSLHLVFIR